MISKNFIIASISVLVIAASSAHIATYFGIIPSSFSNLSAVFSSDTNACYTATDVALLTKQKNDLEALLIPASKIPNDKSINWHISEEEKAKKVLETEITTTTASLATLKRSIPTATVLATASKKIKDLRDEKTKLEAKITKTVADTNRLKALPALIEVAVSAEVKLLAIAPSYNSKSEAFTLRKTELLTQIESKKKAISELNASKKTLTDNLTSVKKELAAAPSKLCSLLCLSTEEISKSQIYTENITLLPGKIKTYEDRLASSKLNLEKYKKTMALEDALRKTATPAAITKANTDYLDAKTKYDDAFKKGTRGAVLQPFVDAKSSTFKKYEDLKFAETRYEASKISLESAENIIKTYPDIIKTFKAELAEAKAKNPGLVNKATKVRGLKCDVSQATVTTGINNTNPTTNVNPAINTNLGARNSGAVNELDCGTDDTGEPKTAVTCPDGTPACSADDCAINNDRCEEEPEETGSDWNVSFNVPFVTIGACDINGQCNYPKWQQVGDPHIVEFGDQTKTIFTCRKTKKVKCWTGAFQSTTKYESDLSGEVRTCASTGF